MRPLARNGPVALWASWKKRKKEEGGGGGE